jgi:hypothetical protein
MAAARTETEHRAAAAGVISCTGHGLPGREAFTAAFVSYHLHDRLIRTVEWMDWGMSGSGESVV